MCLQSFRHFTCSHDDTVVTHCETGARVADLVPFYMPIACPDYQIAQVQSPYACGAQQYCSETDYDGTYLAQILQQQQLAKDKLTELEQQLTYIKLSTSSLSQQLHNSGLSNEAIRQHPQFQHQMGVYNSLWQTKYKVLRTIKSGEEIIKRAQTCGQKLQLEEAQPKPAAQAQSDHATGSVDHQTDHSQLEDPTYRLAPFTPRHESSLTSSPYRVSGREWQHEVSRAGEDSEPGLIHDLDKLHQKQQAEDSQTELNAKPKRQRPRTRTLEKQTEAESEHLEPVRRSARTRHKKVNYAETEDSSRSMSPVKSDYSNISPSRAAIDDEAGKRRTRAQLTSVSINANNSVSSKTRTRRTQRTGSNALEQPSGSNAYDPRDSRESSVSSNIIVTPAKPMGAIDIHEASSPPSKHPKDPAKGPGMEREDSHAPAMKHDQRSNPTLSGGDMWRRKIWPQKVPDTAVPPLSSKTTHRHSAEGQAPSAPPIHPQYHNNNRRDSAHHKLNPVKTQADHDYNELQRSLNLVPDFSHHASATALSNMSTTQSEPTKRPPTSPHPDSLVAKRVRLDPLHNDSDSITLQDSTMQALRSDSAMPQLHTPQLQFQTQGSGEVHSTPSGDLSWALHETQGNEAGDQNQDAEMLDPFPELEWKGFLHDV